MFTISVNSLRLVRPCTAVLPLPCPLVRLPVTQSGLLPTKPAPSDPIKPLKQVFARKANSDPDLKLCLSDMICPNFGQVALQHQVQGIHSSSKAIDMLVLVPNH